MENEETLVFVTNDLVLFPNSEIRFEIDSNYDKDFFHMLNESDRKEVLVVNPYENNKFPDVTMLPSIGVFANLLY